MMSFNYFYRAAHFGIYDKNLIEEFIARWPEKFRGSNIILDGFCLFNNTSGDQFVKFEQ